MTYPNHLEVVAESLAPQPWMQQRLVASGTAESVSKSYAPTDGEAKNDALQALQVLWTNTTPIDQYVYGLMTKSGSQVTLQCRSRGYITTGHGARVDTGVQTPVITEVSRFGIGSDLGKGGILATGGAFGISELRQNSVTMPFQPHLTGWIHVPVGKTITARVEVKFVSEFWESSNIDGGDGDTESKVITGGIRLDLFALPVMAAIPSRQTPTIVGTASYHKVGTPITVSKPPNIQAGDTLLAVCGNQYGSADAITPPAGWSLLHAANEGFWSGNGSHLRIFHKIASGSEPASYTFGNSALAEQIAFVMAVRNADAFVSDANSSGWSVASTKKKWAKTGNMHVAPTLECKGQLLICVSFYGRTDSPVDGVLGPAPGVQSAPTGMTQLADISGTSASMNIAYLANPPFPTGLRTFTSTPRAFFSSYAIAASIVIPGVSG